MISVLVSVVMDLKGTTKMLDYNVQVRNLIIVGTLARVHKKRGEERASNCLKAVAILKY